MRKIIFLLLISFAVAAPCLAAVTITPGTGAHTHADANTGGNSLAAVTFTGSPTSTKACASGYTRVSPNLCLRDPTDSTTTVMGACSGITLPDSAAKAVILWVMLSARTNNLVQNRNVTAQSYTDAACTAGNETGYWNLQAREWVAVLAGSLAASYGSEKVIRVSGDFGLKFTNDPASGQGDAAYRIRGYYD